MKILDITGDYVRANRFFQRRNRRHKLCAACSMGRTVRSYLCNFPYERPKGIDFEMERSEFGEACLFVGNFCRS